MRLIEYYNGEHLLIKAKQIATVAIKLTPANKEKCIA